MFPKYNSVKRKLTPSVVDRPIRLDRERPNHKLRVRSIGSIIPGPGDKHRAISGLIDGSGAGTETGEAGMNTGLGLSGGRET